MIRFMQGTVNLLNVGAGDIKLTFDNSNPAETIRAKRIVKDCIRRGYALLVEVERDGEKRFERALDFDEAKGVYRPAGARHIGWSYFTGKQMIKICDKGHITGNRKCHCGAATSRLEMPPPHQALDKRFKRAVTKSIREAGGIAAADLRSSRTRGQSRPYMPPYGTVYRPLI